MADKNMFDEAFLRHPGGDHYKIFNSTWTFKEKCLNPFQANVIKYVLDIYLRENQLKI